MNESLQTTETLDPLKASLDCLMAIIIPHSTSKNYPIAIQLAQKAMKYRAAVLGGKHIHFVGIEPSRAGALRANAILNYVSGWKGTQVIINGKPLFSPYAAIDVLRCFTEACGCNDYRAHCYVIIDRPIVITMKYIVGPRLLSLGPDGDEAFRQYNELDTSPKILFPCRYISDYGVVQPLHPSTLEDQVQAAAIRHGCDWCPFFDPANVAIINVNDESKRKLSQL